MADLLDSLEWKPWPKDKMWLYADIKSVARISQRRGSELYSIRALHENGELGGFLLKDIDADKLLATVEELIRLHLLESEEINE